jgi:protein-disulfide isomerase
MGFLRHVTTWGRLVVVFGLATACNAGANAAAPQSEGATPPSDNPLIAVNDAAKGVGKAPGPASGADKNPCPALKEAVCGRVGPMSEACAAYTLVSQTLPPEACAVALGKLDGIAAALTAQRASCAELEKKLCADLGTETATCAQVREQSPAIPADRCAEMLEHYGEVLAGLKEAEARNQPLSAEAQAKATAGGAPSFGPADAKVTVLTFSDFECPYCAEAGKVAEALRERYKDRVRLVFRNFPLPFHKNAQPAAEAALAAHAEGKFWPFHDLLFANQDKLDRAGLLTLAAKAGLDVKALEKALDAGTHRAAVEADLALGREIHIEGTPTFYVNGVLVPNPTDLDAVAAQIDTALAK